MTMSPSYVAGGDINPFRFVKVTDEFTVSQAGANDRVVGVAQEGTHLPPGVRGSDGLAASAGESVTVHGPGETPLIEVGAPVNAGDILKSDANGRAIPVTFAENAVTYYGARALENGAALGVRIRCQVMLGSIKPA